MDQCKQKGHLLKLYYRNMFKPHSGDSETFQEYRETAFLPYIINQLRNVERMDVVCGTDISPSALKIRRGARDERIAVEASDRTPASLEIGQPPRGLTRTNRNFSLSVEQLTLIETDHGEVVSTKHEKVVFNNAELKPEIYYLACTKKLHAAGAARRGYTHVMVRTVDTNVYSHRIAKFQYIFLSKLWIEFDVGKYLK